MKLAFLWTLGIIVMSCLVSCQGDEFPGIDPVMIQFDEDLVILENSGEIEIDILLEREAEIEGIVEINVTSTLVESIQTIPAIEDGIISVPIMKGQSSAAFKITPVNNIVLNEPIDIEFEFGMLSDGFIIGTKSDLMVTIEDDEAPSPTNFSLPSATIYENNDGEFFVSIALLNPAPAEGQVIVEVSAESMSSFSTIPTTVDGQIKLIIPVGSNSASFSLIPVNNSVINGTSEVHFTIIEANGGITLGDQLSFNLQLIDDELIGMPKSYISTGGGWSSSKAYEYDEAGRVRKVYWETQTPFLRSGVHTYYYAENGLIERVNEYPNYDRYFIQEDGRIVSSEVIDFGVKKSYTLYDYDPDGNIGGMAVYHRQISGEYLLSLVYVYLNDINGNIYSQLTYYPRNGSKDQLELISTITYGTYYENSNPFPSFEVIPGLVSQPRLPGSYHVEENGGNLFYNMSYEFNENGMPVKRYVSGSGNEFTSYEYYE